MMTKLSRFFAAAGIVVVLSAIVITIQTIGRLNLNEQENQRYNVNVERINALKDGVRDFHQLYAEILRVALVAEDPTAARMAYYTAETTLEQAKRALEWLEISGAQEQVESTKRHLDALFEGIRFDLELLAVNPFHEVMRQMTQEVETLQRETDLNRSELQAMRDRDSVRVTLISGAGILLTALLMTVVRRTYGKR
jgi:formate dehydrogenase maturation protein FdhE